MRVRNAPANHTLPELKNPSRLFWHGQSSVRNEIAEMCWRVGGRGWEGGGVKLCIGIKPPDSEHTHITHSQPTVLNEAPKNLCFLSYISNKQSHTYGLPFYLHSTAVCTRRQVKLLSASLMTDLPFRPDRKNAAQLHRPAIYTNDNTNVAYFSGRKKFSFHSLLNCTFRTALQRERERERVPTLWGERTSVNWKVPRFRPLVLAVAVV